MSNKKFPLDDSVLFDSAKFFESRNRKTWEAGHLGSFDLKLSLPPEIREKRAFTQSIFREYGITGITPVDLFSGGHI